MRTENMEDWTADPPSCYLTEGHQVAGEGGRGRWQPQQESESREVRREVRADHLCDLNDKR